MYVSHSECDNAALCGRRHHYSYVRRIVPNSRPDHLTEGTVAHMTVASVHQSLAAGEAVWDDFTDDVLTAWLYDAAISQYTNPHGTVNVPAVQHCVERLERSFHLWRANPDIGNLYRSCTIVDVEAVRFTPITDSKNRSIGIDLKSVVDVALKTPGGIVMLGEYKTFGDMRKVEWVSMGDQYRRYLYAWPEAAGVWFIGLKGVGLKGAPGVVMRWQGRSKAGQRRAMGRLNYLAEYASQLHDEYNELGEVPAENPEYHCQTCDYAPLCQLTLEGQDDIAAVLMETGYHHEPSRTKRAEHHPSTGALPVPS